MTNPNNAIGTNGAFGGRTSVNAFNDDLSAWSRGVMSGWACVPDSGMTVALGGDSNIRDVAVAVDDAGNRTTINNISQAPVNVTIPGAPASNTRIDSIVAYVDNPPQGSATITGNYESCGIIVVSGTATANPVAPNESTIRTAITADGATGATAYYVVLANVRVANGTTDITAGEIEPGDISGLVGEGVVKANNIDFATTSVTATVTRENGQSFTSTVTKVHLGGNLYCYLYNQEPGFVNTSDNMHVSISIPANRATILGGSITPCISNEIHFDLVGHQSISSDNSQIFLDVWACRGNTSTNTLKVSATIYTIEP